MFNYEKPQDMIIMLCMPYQIFVEKKLFRNLFIPLVSLPFLKQINVTTYLFLNDKKMFLGTFHKFFHRDCSSNIQEERNEIQLL